MDDYKKYLENPDGQDNGNNHHSLFPNMGNGPKESNYLTDWENEPDVDTLRGDLRVAEEFQREKISLMDTWNHLREAHDISINDYNKSRSTFESKLIKKQLGWAYAAYTEAFLSAKQLFTVRPRSFEDTRSANQNEMMLNYQFDTKLNKVKFIDDYVRSAVDDGTVMVKVGWIQETETVTEKFPVFNYVAITDPEQVQVVEQQLNIALELKEEDASEFLALSETVRESVRKYEEEGKIVDVTITERKEVTYEKVLKNQPTVEVLDPRNVYIDPGCEGDYTKARFIVHTYETTKAALMADDRYKNLDAVDWAGASVVHGTNGGVEHTPSEENHNNMDVEDENKRKVVVNEYWGYHDKDGEGVLEPIMASWIGNILVRLEDNPHPDKSFPFVIATYQPVKRELYGEADAAILENSQRLEGSILRGIVDLLGKSANSQVGIAQNLLDANNKAKFDRGENYEYNASAGSPQQLIISHTFPDVGAAPLNMLNLINRDAEGLTGNKVFTGGINGDAFGDVATGINATLESTAQRQMSTIRRLAQGIKDIGDKIAVMNQEFLSDEEVIRVTNKGFVTVKREDLAGRYNIIVDISSNALDEKNAHDLLFIYQTVGNTLPLEITQVLLGKVLDLKKMPVEAEKIKKHKPSDTQTRMSELDLRLKELEVQKVESEIELNKSKADQTQSKADLDKTANLKETTGLGHAEEKEKQSEQARGNIELEFIKALLAPRKEGESPGNVELAMELGDLTSERSRAEVDTLREQLRALVETMATDTVQKIVDKGLQSRNNPDNTGQQ